MSTKDVPLPEPDIAGYLSWRPHARKDVHIKTWFRINGSLKSSATPLVVLHGGPGAAHNYCLSMLDLAQDRPVIFYDQVGCGKSSHFPGEKYADLWSVDLFVQELRLLLDHLGVSKFHLLGQSFGGFLALAYANSLKSTKHIQGLILADTLDDYPEGIAAMQPWIDALPQNERDAISEAIKSGDFTAPEFKKAEKHFYDLHVCRIVPNPPEVAKSFAQQDEDPTVFDTLNGPSEFIISGPLKTATTVPECGKLTMPMLIVYGKYDELRYCQDSIKSHMKKAASIHMREFPNSSHLPHWEDRAEYMEYVGGWLKDIEAKSSWNCLIC